VHSKDKDPALSPEEARNPAQWEKFWTSAYTLVGVFKPPDAQTQHWSLVSCEAVPSGQVGDGLSGFQIPLDVDRNYTIVVSRPEDRPKKNATLENGLAWLKWSPRGEGLDDPRNRPDFGIRWKTDRGLDPVNSAVQRRRLRCSVYGGRFGSSSSVSRSIISFMPH
jgi:hypothetical protein